MQTDTTTDAMPAVPEDKPAGRPIPLDPDALLYTSEAAFLTALSPRTLEMLRLRGGGPPYIALRRRAIRYRRSDIMEWIEACQRRSTSDLGPMADVPAPVEG